MSNIYLGNLSISEFLKRTGYNMTDEDIHILESHRQDTAKVDPLSDKFHIFDIPFSICVAEPYKNELLKIIMKYDDVSPSKTTLAITVATESEKEKELRLKKEQEKRDWEEKLENPNSVWNVKWHMLVPVKVNNTEVYYGCFINTYTTGRTNIPDIINGTATIRMDESGFHGTFSLENPENDNDANDHPEWNWVIGSGFYKLSGNYIGHVENAYFEDTKFSLKDAIETYLNIDSCHNSKEIHFSHINTKN